MAGGRYLGFEPRAKSNPVRAIDAFVEALDLAELGFDGIKPAETGRPAYPRPEQTRTAVMFYNWKGRVLQTPFPAHAGVLDSFPF